MSLILLFCCSQITVSCFCQILLIPKTYSFAISYTIKFQLLSAPPVPRQPKSPLVLLCSLCGLSRTCMSEALPVLCKPGPGSLSICTFLQEKQWHVLAFRDSKARLYENHFVWAPHVDQDLVLIPKTECSLVDPNTVVFLLDLNGFATFKLLDTGQSQLLFTWHKCYSNYKRVRCLCGG